MVLHCECRLQDNGVVCRTAGLGSTPTCSVPDDSLASLTEFHPGNYIFYGRYVFNV